MKHILAPTDFSPESINAADYAASLAHALGATLHLINIVKPPVLMDDSMLAPIMITQAEIIDENKRLMESEKKRLSYGNLITVTGQVTEGYPAEAVIKSAEKKEADLIVMGMKGKGKSNSLFGSTTTTVIRKAIHPVLVIPLQATYKPIQHITLASDFDFNIETKKYTVLQSLLEKSGAELNILNIQRKTESLDKNEAAGKMRISLIFSKNNPRFHVLAEKQVEEGIQQFIQKTPTNILVMVAHQHSLPERLFGNVHTRNMSYLTRVPLLVIQNK